MKKLIAPALLLFILSGCGTSPGAEEQAKNDETQSQTPPYGEVRVNEEGFDLVLAAPEDYLGSSPVNIEMNTAFGHLEVRAEEVYHLTITEDTPDWNQLFTKLDNDLLFKSETVQKYPDAVLYRQYLPDESKEFWHFYLTIVNQNREYIVKDHTATALNEYQATRIFEALRYAASNLNDPPTQ